MRTIALRVRLLSIGFMVSVLAISVRLFFWQVVRGEELAIAGRVQQQSASRILAQRGDILSSDGTWLTASMEAWLLYASRPEFAESPKLTAEKLADIFIEEMDFDTPVIPESSDSGRKNPDEIEKLKKEALQKEEDRIGELLSKEELVWIPIKNRVSRVLREQIEALDIPGLHFEEQEARAYP